MWVLIRHHLQVYGINYRMEFLCDYVVIILLLPIYIFFISLKVPYISLPFQSNVHILYIYTFILYIYGWGKVRKGNYMAINGRYKESAF